MRQRILLGIVWFILMPRASIDAQNWVRPADRILYYEPVTAISAQIHAEADFFRAYGDMAVDLAAADEIRAQARQLEIQNSVDAVRAYWERRSIIEAERLKRKKTLVQRQEIRNSHLWKRLKDHPELSTGAVENGTALNFLLNRLAGGVLAYSFSPGNDGTGIELLDQLQLSPETVHQLRVKQDLFNGSTTVFRLDEGAPLELNWWPGALRASELKRPRTQFETARAAALQSSPEDLDDKLKELFAAYDALSSAFRSHYTRSVRLRSVNACTEYNQANRFLQGLLGEMQRIRNVGPKALKDDSLRFEGNNLVGLLTHMSRNGLEFAAPMPGDEPAYHQVFHMMRDLYVTVADESKNDGQNNKAE